LLLDRYNEDVKFRARCAGADIKDEPRYLTDEQVYRKFEAMAKASGGA